MELKKRSINQISALWGLAEATFFFIVPDVLLSYSGRNKLKTGLIACCYSLLGALLGGLVMYYWGYSNQLAVNQFLERIPAIDMELINSVKISLNEQGVTSVLFAPLSGIPYKIYAAQAAAQDVSLQSFLLISIPARIIRFMLITIFFHFALQAINKKINKKHNLAIILVSWVSFYLFYFWTYL